MIFFSKRNELKLKRTEKALQMAKAQLEHLLKTAERNRLAPEATISKYQLNSTLTDINLALEGKLLEDIINR